MKTLKRSNHEFSAAIALADHYLLTFPPKTFYNVTISNNRLHLQGDGNEEVFTTAKKIGFNQSYNTWHKYFELQLNNTLLIFSNYDYNGNILPK